MRTTHCLLVVLLVVAPSCGEEVGDSGLETCIEDAVTIEHGIYGQLVDGCDTEDCTWSYAVDTEVRVYDADPTPPGGPSDQGLHDAGTDLTPIARTTSGPRGVYELSLAPGSYYLCANACTAALLAPSPALARFDWASGPGGGRWFEGECSDSQQ